MKVRFRPDLLIPDILRGTVGTTPRSISPHRLPLCTYCDHSYLDHSERRGEKPGEIVRLCQHDPPCGCPSFLDPDGNLEGNFVPAETKRVETSGDAK